MPDSPALHDLPDTAKGKIKKYVEHRHQDIALWMADGRCQDFAEYTRLCGRVQELRGFLTNLDVVMQSPETDPEDTGGSHGVVHE